MEKVLVIIDMQNDFTTGVLGNDRCAAAIDTVVAHLKETSYDKVVLTRDTHQTNYMQTQEGRNLPVEHCIEGTKGWEVADAIMDVVNEKYPEAKIYNKPTFGSVEMGEDFRKEFGTGEEVEITFMGVCTGICVLSNVTLVKAFCPEAKITVIDECCACVTEDTHKTALDAMKTIQVSVL